MSISAISSYAEVQAYILAARRTLIVCLVVLAALIFAQVSFASETITGKVVRVADGDTITVLTLGNQQVKVRFYGVDCPEKKQAFGQRARQFTASMVAGQQVDVEVINTDRYGRAVGVIISPDGTNVNQALLANGFAWYYGQYCKAPFCRQWKQEEMMARRDRRGLWVDKNPIEPWNWRKMRLKQH